MFFIMFIVSSNTSENIRDSCISFYTLHGIKLCIFSMDVIFIYVVLYRYVDRSTFRFAQKIPREVYHVSYFPLQFLQKSAVLV